MTDLKNAIAEQNNICYYSKITVKSHSSFRLCCHNYKELPSNNRLIDNIVNYRIDLNAWMYLFNHLDNNYAYHIVIEGKKTYFPDQDCEDHIVTFVTYSCHLRNEVIIIIDVDENVYKITSDMIINLFIIRKIKCISCVKLHNCVFTKLFEYYEFTRTKFMNLNNMKTYSSNCHNLHMIPKISNSSINTLNCTWLNINKFKVIFKRIKPHFKQVKIVRWNNQCQYMVVYQLQQWKDKGILGKRRDRRGIKLISIDNNDDDIIVYEDDTYVKELIVIRNVIINHSTEVKVVLDSSSSSWR